MNDTTAGTPISSLPATCLRKKAYPNEARAWSIVFGLRARQQDTSNLAPYRCDHCAQWHLGRQPSRVAAIAAIRNPA